MFQFKLPDIGEGIVEADVVKWRVKDVVQYLTSADGNPDTASNRLSAVIQKSLKDEFGKRTIQQAVSGERQEISDLLRQHAEYISHLVVPDFPLAGEIPKYVVFCNQLSKIFVASHDC